jgi:membrane protein involved in colicin uptake
MQDLTNKMWESYPDAKEFFVTADEQFFFNEVQATNHANSLGEGQQEVKHLKRAEVKTAKTDAKAKADAEAKAKADAEAKAKADAEAKAKADANGKK